MTKPKAKSKVKATTPTPPVFDVRQLLKMFDSTPATEVTRDALPVAKTVVPSGPPPPTIAVVLTCHAEYLPYLRRAVDAIEAQTRPANELVVALDGCEAPPWLRSRQRWYIIRGDYGNPNPMRNLGIQATASDWLVFSDADDTMHPAYLMGLHATIEACGPQVGIVNADIHTATGELQTPNATDYWALRRRNYVSSASGWRRGAVEEAGGWKDTQQYDDWTLALHVTALGYQTRRNPQPINVRVHRQPHRTDSCERLGHLLHRSYGVATVLTGRGDLLPIWQRQLSDAWWPEHTMLYILNAAGTRDQRFNCAAQQCAQRLLDRFQSVSYMQVPAPLNAETGALRGNYVRALANRLLPLVNEDMLVTVGEDVGLPPDAMRSLLQHYGGDEALAVLGAVCRHEHDESIVAAWRDGGEPVYRESLLDAGCLQVAALGSGLTLWNNGYVRPCLPLHGTHWESTLCQDIAGMGGTVQLDCGVRCQRLGCGKE